jgi:hypothetical protein
LTAEFNEKRWVWVPDEKDGYVAAWVIREDDEIGEVMLAGGNEVSRFNILTSCFRFLRLPIFNAIDAQRTSVCTLQNESSQV